LSAQIINKNHKWGVETHTQDTRERERERGENQRETRKIHTSHEDDTHKYNAYVQHTSHMRRHFSHEETTRGDTSHTRRHFSHEETLRTRGDTSHTREETPSAESMHATKKTHTKCGYYTTTPIYIYIYPGERERS
jgi:hypothetical protein